MESTFQIETPRLLLRRWRPSDREPFAAINADPRVAEFLPAALTREESNTLADLIDGHFERHPFGVFAVEEKEGHPFIGFVGLNVPTFEAPFTPCVEVAWRLASEVWGRGLATEAARAALTFGFESVGLEEILAWTVPANLRSRRVMEKLGMTQGDEFEHPRLPEGHPLRRHVLYRCTK